ncbi:MAG: PEP-CTERM sorting domain-containing protein [Pirellulales bacterium]
MKVRCAAVAIAAILMYAGSAHAQLAYSFESPAVNPDGFGPNGAGVTITQDTIGATQGTHSLKASVVTGATFVGALTGNVNSLINDPPGVNSLLFDMTIGPNDVFPGAFALVGVTIFGASQPDYPGGQQFGLQAQFADFEHIDGKAPGTYTVQIDLNSATHPLTFATGQSFNQIFGTVGSGANDVIPTGVQFFLNKSNDAPLTVYIDNVRVVGTVPEPATIGMLSMGAVVFGSLIRRRRS